MVVNVLLDCSHVHLIILAGNKMLSEQLGKSEILEVGQRFWWVTDDMKLTREKEVKSGDDTPTLMGAGCISARDAIILDVHKLSNGVLYDIMVTEEASLEKDATWEQVAEAPWWRVIKAPL